jgi:alpha-1,3-glucosyltransferase
VEELQELDNQRRELAIRHEASQTAEEKMEDEDTPMPDVPQTNGKHEPSDNSDVEPARMRHRHERVIDRKRKREEEAARRAKERKEKAAATKFSKEETKLKKLTTQIDDKKERIKECEELILDLNNDLRETDCQRTKCLGRDRFCNRYYWFERNGMPFGGVPRTSTAHYGYANARIWVQGADADERKGFVDLPAAEQAAYRARFGCTVPERQRQEEGATRLTGPAQWGYYDAEGDVDDLVVWLDERGVRERALRKELLAWRDVIVECMGKLALHRDGEAERMGGGTGETPKTRVSTRTKTYVDLDATRWTCLAWRNSMAVETFGTKHSDGTKRRGRPPKAKIALDRKGRLTGKRGGRH